MKYKITLNIERDTKSISDDQGQSRDPGGKKKRPGRLKIGPILLSGIILQLLEYLFSLIF